MIRTLLAALAVAAMSVSQAAADWHEVKTPNFTVVGDTDVKKLEEMAVELERFRRFIGIIHSGKLMPLEPVNVPVYILKNERSYREIFDSSVSGGVYTHRIETPIFLVNAELDYSRSLVRGQKSDKTRQSREFLKHEYTHHFLFINGPYYYPLWYAEGMADYYSSFTYVDGMANVGELLSIRGGWLIFDDLLEWEDVFKSNTSWITPTDSDQLTVRDVSRYYAQSWIVTHYLMSDTGRRAQLFDYLDRLQLDNTDYEGTFQAAFGKSMEEMGEEVGEYLKTNRLTVLNYNLPEFDVTVEPVSRKMDDWEEDMAILFAQRFFANTKKEVTELREGLERLSEKRPQETRPLIELGFLELDEGNNEVAAEIASRAYALEPENSMVLVLKALTGPFTERGSMLIEAMEADPANPLALYQYALRYQNVPNEKVLNAAIEAMYRSADTQTLPLLVGTLLVDMEQYEDAKIVLQPISKWGADIGIRRQAEYQLSRIPSPKTPEE